MKCTDCGLYACHECGQCHCDEGPKWINVEDELPPECKVVLVFDEFSTIVSLGKVEADGDDYWFVLMNIEGMYPDTEVTHWMPLPEAPRE